MQTSSDRETLRSGRSGSGGDGCATEQIVGRERRERVSQLAWCGDGCFDSRRRVNSTVMRLFWTETVLLSVALVCVIFGVGVAQRRTPTRPCPPEVICDPPRQ